MTRFLIIGDLHGQLPKLSVADYDILIAPGDFCSDLREVAFMEARKRREDPTFKKRWYDILGREEARVKIDEALRNGRKVLEFLNSTGKPVYCVPGNWDFTGERKEDWEYMEINQYAELIKGLENIHDVHLARADMGDLEVIGYGISNSPEYPQTDDEKARLTTEQLGKKKADYDEKVKTLSALFDQSSKPVLFLTHNVPYGTSLDLITNKDSPVYGKHFGSAVARYVVDTHSPIACIGGHMHEHHDKEIAGNTVVINAGFGPNVNTLLEVKEGRVALVEFYRAGRKL